MLTVNTLALDRMRKHLQAMKTEKAIWIAEGACQTFDEYRQFVGYCQALEHVIELCDTVEKELGT